MSVHSFESEHDLQNPRYLVCKHHRKEEYTNFCCFKGCLEPLCPACIDDHNKSHKSKQEFPEVDTLKMVHKMSQKQTTTAISAIKEELKRVKNFKNRSLETILEDVKKDFKDSQRAIHEAVDAFFEDIFRDYEQSVRTNFNRNIDFGDCESELKKALEELESLDYQLNTKKYLVSAIRRVCRTDLTKFVYHYQETVREKLGQGLFVSNDVAFGPQNTNDMKDFLRRYLVPRRQVAGYNPKDKDIHILKKLNLENQEAANYFDKKLKQSAQKQYRE